jgi:predicted NUDIX family phosphoesterase
MSPLVAKCLKRRIVSLKQSVYRIANRRVLGTRLFPWRPVLFPSRWVGLPKEFFQSYFDMPKDEEVLVVPARLLDELGAFSGFQQNVERYLPAILDRSNQSFRPRSIVEDDPSFKQLIPYVILECSDENHTQLFQYTRGKGQGEKRLHALRSIGIGGHISVEDTSGDDWYATGMQRELAEEVTIECGGQQRIVGLIYDDTSEVGRVHLGIVHIMQLSSCKVSSAELELEFAGFRQIDTIQSEIDRYETWSQLCIKHLYS